jgi:hypothetical protein
MNKTRKNGNKYKNRTVKYGQPEKNVTKKMCIDRFITARMKRYKTFKLGLLRDLEKYYKKALEKKDLAQEDRKVILRGLKRVIREKNAKHGININIQKKTETGIFCNPGCKGTLLEPGNKLSNTYLEEHKPSKEVLKLFGTYRKTVFGNKTNVLIDDFYEKAPKKMVDKIKKDGGISLCWPMEKVDWY